MFWWEIFFILKYWRSFINDKYCKQNGLISLCHIHNSWYICTYKCAHFILMRCKIILHKMCKMPAVQNNEKNVFITNTLYETQVNYYTFTKPLQNFTLINRNTLFKWWTYTDYPTNKKITHEIDSKSSFDIHHWLN